MTIKRLGLFGGTFNPIHFGHLRLALEMQEAFHLDEVIFIPAGLPPHRSMPHVSGQQRAEMIRLAIATQPQFVLSTYEIEKKTPSYSVETLRYFRTIYPEAAFFLFLGMDAFLGLPQWYQWEQLFDLTHLIVATRSGYTFPQTWDWITPRLRQNDSPIFDVSQKTGLIYQYNFTELAISATKIRTLIQNNKSVCYLLPEEVINYIQTHHLYL